MKVEFRILTAVLLACLLAPGAMAVNLGSDVTLYDGIAGARANGLDEDQETEDNTILSDAWDLERVLFDATPGDDFLRIVGTYNFLAGVSGDSEAATEADGTSVPDSSGPRTDNDAGDIFIVGTDLLANGSLFLPELLGSGGWYLNMHWESYVGSSVSFDIYALDADGDANSNPDNATLLNTGYVNGVNNTNSSWNASPWRVDGTNPGSHLGNGTATLSTIADGDLDGVAGDEVTRFSGSGHNVLTLNWSSIVQALGLSNQDFSYTVHFTMSCGNDVIYGANTSNSAPPVPEPASMALLGMGILGFAMRRRFTA